MTTLDWLGDFAAVDDFLDVVDVGRLDAVLAVGLLAITLPAKERLRRRSDYYQRVDFWLFTTEPTKRAALLVGLK